MLAPRVFALEHIATRAELTDFLQKIRQLAVKPGANVRIDFRATVHMTAPGTLLFAAELERIFTVIPGVRLSCNYPSKGVVAQVLQHVGIFKLLGQKRTCDVTAGDVICWRVHSGQAADGEAASRAMADYTHLFPKGKLQGLYRGLTEAMTNCRQHAYEEARGDGLRDVPNWWMYSEYRDGRLVVAFCDLGMGIPRSLPQNNSGMWENIRAFMTELRLPDDDVSRIKAAMAIGASRTKKKYRGKGLLDIRSVVDALHGKLHIHSNRGFYQYDGKDGREQCTNFRKSMSVLGTLVIWQLPVVTEAQ